MHFFILQVLVCFNFFRKVFLTPIHVPYQRALIMGFVDVHWVNFPIWGWNNSTVITVRVKDLMKKCAKINETFISQTLTSKQTGYVFHGYICS